MCSCTRFLQTIMHTNMTSMHTDKLFAHILTNKHTDTQKGYTFIISNLEQLNSFINTSAKLFIFLQCLLQHPIARPFLRHLAFSASIFTFLFLQINKNYCKKHYSYFYNYTLEIKYSKLRFILILKHVCLSSAGYKQHTCFHYCNQRIYCLEGIILVT